MLAACRGALGGALSLLPAGAAAAQLVGLAAAAAATGCRSSAAARSLHSAGPSSGEFSHVIDEHGMLVGSQTPVTKHLWKQRYTWTEERLQQAAPRDPTAAAEAKPPNRLSVKYPFTSDPVVKEHYRNPWSEARIGRILEDLDSLAGFVAFDHCDDGDPTTRPPLLVTATVEKIELRGKRINLDQDMELSGRVVWTGSSSMDIVIELEQAGQQQLTSLFTFVAREPLTGAPCRIPSVLPQTPEDQALFAERQAVNAARKAARKAGAGKLHQVSPEGEQWARELLAAAKTKRDLPALADAHAVFMDDTSLSNTFTCQPEERNMHGRIFGGFLMRRAFELAHSTAYLFAGCRPLTVEVDGITFRRPVNVGDLIRFRSWVLRSWPSQHTPGKGVVHVQVEASVTQPEKLQSEVTNQFGFRFIFDLRRDQWGTLQMPRQVLPGAEQQALEVAQRFGPGAKQPAP
ncbi:Acyl-coenzyme A thioesterase mitochondrial [Chlorella sorokiniana]|uniref:Acyl-coenzyme A thioesterase mitochondrial n=1 Tax=Chlorella sorokiniana TaxID=3076 RepID=A0A2P6TE69_CHLSO|nr:Acyl-coenzyme A thioesterase mitochondrial [Chlorella sorokiniana]|eukprot:PRW20940.1 Acyl-coenzyme A thioesterase mitochondrial [Chlorella sorokiniana]